MFASAKGKQQKQVRQLQCIDHIPYVLLGLLRAHFIRRPFSKQLSTFKSACIYKFKVYCAHVSHRPRFFHSDEPRRELYIQTGKSWDLEAICECQEFAPGLLSYLLWTMNPKRKKIGSISLRIKRGMLINHFICCLQEAVHFKWRGCNAHRLFRSLLQDSFVTLTFKSVDENLWCQQFQ